MILFRQNFKKWLKIYNEDFYYLKNLRMCTFYSYTLLVWVSVFFSSNKRQNSWTDRAQILCGTSHDPREGLWNIKTGKKILENIWNFFIGKNAPIRKEKSAEV